MNPFRTLRATLSAQFADFIEQIENHEAVADGLIREVERSAAKAKVQLGRVRGDGERLARRMAELEAAKQQWTARALRCGEADRPRALECMSRLERADTDAKACEQQLTEQRKLAGQLGRDLASIEENLAALRRKRNALASREARAETLRILHEGDLGVLSEIDGLFARWETKVTQYELGSSGDALAVDDELASTFSKEEERARLETSLDRLLRQGKE